MTEDKTTLLTRIVIDIIEFYTKTAESKIFRPILAVQILEHAIALNAKGREFRVKLQEQMSKDEPVDDDVWLKPTLEVIDTEIVFLRELSEELPSAQTMLDTIQTRLREIL